MSSSYSGPTRWIVADDSNPRINYTTLQQWSATQGTSDGQGLTGLPFNNTLHASEYAESGKPVSLSLTFTGTSVTVYSVDNFLNISGATSPNVECVIDNINSHMSPPSFNGNGDNNWILCEQYNLDNKLHTVTINAWSNAQPFLFDRIQYQRKPYIDNPDSSIDYGQGWVGLGGEWFSYTSKTNTTLDFEFLWYGVTPADFPGYPATITYVIDGGSPQVVVVPEHSENSPNLSNQKYFEISTLSMGQHRLSVVYNGNSTTTPLTLDYLVIPITNNKHPKHTGAIIGGFVAAFVILVLILALFFLFVRRRRRLARREEIRNASANEVNPFDVRTSRRASTNSKLELSSTAIINSVTLDSEIARAESGWGFFVDLVQHG
ncbi:hypothetical protein CPB83DRAFT_879737 [Crepidotus variabilis]|uniref:Uncharacterized protein n=1 Tax=Crepidotus variabilis TaxID=179855 RepID=A0A9P6ERV6_9AGAR|nr:hypothetical protein CPB83DRAFT_879737 [Crepidotus variabilis]